MTTNNQAKKIAQYPPLLQNQRFLSKQKEITDGRKGNRKRKKKPYIEFLENCKEKIKSYYDKFNILIVADTKILDKEEYQQQYQLLNEIYGLNLTPEYTKISIPILCIYANGIKYYFNPSILKDLIGEYWVLTDRTESQKIFKYSIIQKMKEDGVKIENISDSELQLENICNLAGRSKRIKGFIENIMNPSKANLTSIYVDREYFESVDISKEFYLSKADKNRLQRYLDLERHKHENPSKYRSSRKQNYKRRKKNKKYIVL